MKWNKRRQHASENQESDHTFSDTTDADYFAESNENHNDLDMTQVYGQELFNRQEFEEKQSDYPSRRDYHGHYDYEADDSQAPEYSDIYSETTDYQEPYYQDDIHFPEETGEGYEDYRERYDEDEASSIDPNARRSKYSAKMDSFLNNGIIITGILLIMVLLIAFLV